jgi:hypothetical protein
MTLKTRRNLMLVAALGSGSAGLFWSIKTAMELSAGSGLGVVVAFSTLLSFIVVVMSGVSLAIRLWNDQE